MSCPFFGLFSSDNTSTNKYNRNVVFYCVNKNLNQTELKNLFIDLWNCLKKIKFRPIRSNICLIFQHILGYPYKVQFQVYPNVKTAAFHSNPKYRLKQQLFNGVRWSFTKAGGPIGQFYPIRQNNANWKKYQENGWLTLIDALLWLKKTQKSWNLSFLCYVSLNKVGGS